MPVYLNPTRNVLSFGARPPLRPRGTSLFPDTTSPKTLPVDAVTVIELTEQEARPYLDRGLLRPVDAKASAPVTAKDVMGKTEVYLSSSLTPNSDLAKAIPPGRPMPAPAEVAKKPEPVAEKVEPPKANPVPKKAFKPKGFATPKKAVPQKFVSPPVSVKEYDNALSDDHPMRAKEAAQGAQAEGNPEKLAAALAKVKKALASPEPPVQEAVPVGEGPVTSPFKDDVGPAAPLDTTPPAADTPVPPIRRRYVVEPS